jgi:hypothetical protein
MSVSRHLVDPQIIEMLDMPSLDLTDETLPEIRANPLFTGELVPPPPFPVSEAFARVEGAPDVRLVIMNPPSEATNRGAFSTSMAAGWSSGRPTGGGRQAASRDRA